jgi:hypothetical protein
MVVFGGSGGTVVGSGNVLKSIISYTRNFKSCNEIAQAYSFSGSTGKDGAYRIYLNNGKVATTVYCDMTTDGGGWTMVWSNLAGKTGKITTNMPWNTAIGTAGLLTGSMSTGTYGFEYYL